jgi:hypothetical protein
MPLVHLKVQLDSLAVTEGPTPSTIDRIVSNTHQPLNLNINPNKEFLQLPELHKTNYAIATHPTILKKGLPITIKTIKREMTATVIGKAWTGAKTQTISNGMQDNG